MNGWEDVLPLDDPSGWAELDENGWGMLLAWSAGMENVRRLPATDLGRTVRVATERGGVVTGPWLEPFTPYDRDLIEDGINGYLEDAGVPPRPRGYTWFIRVHPPDMDSPTFFALVNEQVHEAATGVVLPNQWLKRMRDVLNGLYRTV